MRIPVVAAAGLALAVTAAACSAPESTPKDAAAPVPVSVMTAESADLSESFETGGVVRARVVATIVGRIMAPVVSVDVVPGQAVQAGQTLVRLDARDLREGQLRAAAAEAATRSGLAGAEADRRAAESALNLARVTHQRFADLRARNSATQHELDEATAGLRAAESRLTGAEARIAEAKSGVEAASAASRAASVALTYATLTAPFAGIVSEKRVEPGNMASPGQPLLTIEDTRGFRLEVRFDESRAAYVRPGAEVAVRLESFEPGSGGRSDAPALTGRVAEVSRMLDPGSHDFLVKIDLPPGTPGLRSGMYGRARLSGPTRQGIAVPASAVVRRGQLSFVYVVGPDRTAHLRMVNASESSADRIEIRAGLVAGEQIVIAPPEALTDNSPVTIQGAGATRPETRR